MTSSKGSILISGVPIRFPLRPYRSQMQLMRNIIFGLQSGQNCLLESPTGTGKSLAILCACIAWQRHEFRKQRPELESNVQSTYEDVSNGKAGCSGDQTEENKKEKPKKPHVIFFGTRTHKQVEQLVQQLRLTEYARDIKMTVLGSRKQLCIHPTVSTTTDNINEECKRLLKSRIQGMKCQFNNQNIRNDADLQHAKLRCLKPIERAESAAFDIEDLVTVGKSRMTCPYFVSRGLLEEAHVVFCPYNFLLDPRIRSNGTIRLENSIVVLDEAHNIEDHAMETFTFKLRKQDIDGCVAEMEYLLNESYCRELSTECRSAVNYIVPRLSSLSLWITSHRQQLEPTDMFQLRFAVSMLDVLGALSRCNLGPNESKQLGKLVSSLVEQNTEDVPGFEGTPAPPIVSDKALFVLGELMMMMAIIYMNELQYVDSYKAVFTLNVGDQADPETDIVLNLFCLNPAVAFNHMSKGVRSVIVCSGTLAPLKSFSGELGASFPHSISADHIINNNQLFVSVVGEGPSGQKLRCTYKECQNFGFKDELGQCMVKIIQSMGRRGGILVFLPSYRLLNDLITRWKSTRVWTELTALISVFAEGKFEPLSLLPGHKQQLMKDRRRQKVDIIDQYKSAAQTRPGAALFGVFRGRASEGIDFADDTARCVVCIGVPYPNVREITVELKKRFNSERAASGEYGAGLDVGMMDGDEWYNTQAFRAINQAVGRCIRHKNDWGSIVLIDDRHNYRTSNSYLSRWIQTNRRSFDLFADFEMSFREFHQTMSIAVEDHDAQMSQDDQTRANGSCASFQTIDTYTESRSSNLSGKELALSKWRQSRKRGSQLGTETKMKKTRSPVAGSNLTKWLFADKRS